MPRGLDRNIIVFLKVDTSLLFGWVIWYAEELTLKTWIRWTWDMLAISPLAITTTTTG
jgi:hypothetical protein